MKRKGVRTCHTCNKIEGHNSRTCKRLQLEEEEKQQMVKQNSAAEATLESIPENLDTNEDNDSTQQQRMGPRRSSRLQHS